MDKNKEKKEQFLAYYRDLPVQRLAAASIGKNEDTIIRWKNDDAEFADEIEIAAAQWAMKQVKGVRSREWLLERLMRGHFGQAMDVTSKGEKIEGLVIVKDKE